MFGRDKHFDPVDKRLHRRRILHASIKTGAA